MVAAQLCTAGAAEEGGAALGAESVRQGLGDVKGPGPGLGQPSGGVDSGERGVALARLQGLEQLVAGIHKALPPFFFQCPV